MLKVTDIFKASEEEALKKVFELTQWLESIHNFLSFPLVSTNFYLLPLEELREA